jgi:hypothetical protein
MPYEGFRYALLAESELHIAGGTYRPSRHGAALAAWQAKQLEPPREVQPAERRQLLKGLGPVARRVATSVLAEFTDWTAASLYTLRQYAISCETLAGITDHAERRREVRTNLALLRALDLEVER